MTLSGKELRGIKLVGKIGTGGMGTVYHGRMLKARRGLAAGTDVAVKVLHEHLSDDPVTLSHFKKEAGLGLTLRHPNIVKTYQVGSERVDGSQLHFIVEEYVEGVTLKALIEEKCLLSDHFLRKIAMQIVAALCEIHGKQIIHRDLKSANVFLDQRGNVKVVDLGFSHVDRGLKEQSSAQGFLGTVSYAAPERFGADPVSPSSDLYSLGVILYELAVGENPFQAKDLAATIARHMYTRPEDPCTINSNVSPFMGFLIMSLLEKEPDRRLGPSVRVKRILEKGESARWWKSARPDTAVEGVSARRRRINVARRTPVMGRKRELTRLLELWDEVAAGQGCRTVCLHGEAGSGKTRLVDRLLEVMDTTERPGIMWMVEGAQSDIMIPYFPLISALQMGFNLRGIDDRARLREAFQEKLRPLFPSQEKTVERFSHFLISAKPDPDRTAEPMQPELTVRLFSELFTAIAADTPLLLLVENIREADPPTFRVFQQMLPLIRESRIMLVFTARPGVIDASENVEQNEIDDLFETMEGSGGRNIIEMRRLSRASTSRILFELGFPEKVGDGPFGERVFSITEGNPYLILEIARLVEVENRLNTDKDDVNWHGLLNEIPSSIQDIFYRRLFHISPIEREFLDFASVIGMRFRFEEVREGLGLDYKDAVHAVSRLQNRFALIRSIHNLYRFDHVLIRDLLYNRIDPDERALFHRKVGERYIKLAQHRRLSGRDCYRAAVHFFRGKAPDQALPFFDLAFDYLRFKHFHDSALELADNAASYLDEMSRCGEIPDAEFACSLYLKQAEAAGFLGKRDVQFLALKNAMQAVRRVNEPALRARVRLRIGQYHNATSRYISALSTVEGALSLMRKIDDREGEAEALQTLSLVLRNIGDDTNVMKYLRQALAISKVLKLEDKQASVLVDMAEVFMNRGKPVAAKEALDKAMRYYKSLGDEQGLATVLAGLARIDMERGSYHTAVRTLTEAGDIAHEVGDAALESDVYRYLGTCSFKSDDIPRALEFLSESLEIASMIEDLARMVRLLMTRADFYIDPGNPDPDVEKALADARQALASSRKAPLGLKDRVAALECLARVFLAASRPMRALTMYRTALQIHEDEEGPVDQLRDLRRRYERLAKRLKKGRDRSISR